MKDFKRVFLDTSPIVYFLTNDTALHDKTLQILKEIMQSEGEILTSVISCMEYLVYPYREKNKKAVSSFWQFVQQCDINICHIDMRVAEKAADIRANYRYFKAFDSMQIASACINECDLLLTNDKQLRQCEEIQCVTVEDWIVE